MSNPVTPPSHLDGARLALLTALRTGAAAALDERTAETGGLWDTIEREGLAPLLHTRVPQAGRLAAPLAHAARIAAALEVVREREIRRVLDRLAGAGVRPVLLKGTPLAYTVYAAPSERPRADVDLLLPPADLAIARREFAALGYGEPAFCEDLHHQVQVERLESDRLRHAWDLHTRISAHPMFAAVLTWDELSASAHAVPALGDSARAACPLHALLLACVHPAMHHRNTVRLLWLMDVHLLWPRLSQTDREQLADLAIAKGVAAIVAHTLGLAHTHLGTAVPASWLARLAAIRDEPSARFLISGRAWIDEIADSWRALPGWRERLSLLRQVAFPHRTYMRAHYERPQAGAATLPLLYAHRLVHGGWRAVTGQK